MLLSQLILNYQKHYANRIINNINNCSDCVIMFKVFLLPEIYPIKICGYVT